MDKKIDGNLCETIFVNRTSLKPVGYFLYRPVEHYQIPSYAHTVSLRVLSGSEKKTAVIPLYSIN